MINFGGPCNWRMASLRLAFLRLLMVNVELRLRVQILSIVMLRHSLLSSVSKLVWKIGYILCINFTENILL